MNKIATETTTIKVYEKSRKRLKVISGLTGETMMDIIDRLLETEEKKVENRFIKSKSK